MRRLPVDCCTPDAGSYHLKQLADAGVIVRERRGRYSPRSSTACSTTSLRWWQFPNGRQHEPGAAARAYQFVRGEQTRPAAFEETA